MMGTLFEAWMHPRSKHGRWFATASFAVLYVCASVGVMSAVHNFSESRNGPSAGARSLASSTCTPERWVLYHQTTTWYGVFCMAVTIYCFLGLAIVCDEYFVPALEKISENLRLSPDVAGATFMAAGSSAPELFTSIADTFVTENSIGVGTIVGSAMFNILVIVAAAAAATSGNLPIDWRPVSRDVVFYVFSILCLVFFLRDGNVTMYEGAFMVGGYMVYILFMTVNEKIFNLCGPPASSKIDACEDSPTSEPAVGASAVSAAPTDTIKALETVPASHTTAVSVISKDSDMDCSAHVVTFSNSPDSSVSDNLEDRRRPSVNWSSEGARRVSLTRADSSDDLDTRSYIPGKLHEEFANDRRQMPRGSVSWSHEGAARHSAVAEHVRQIPDFAAKIADADECDESDDEEEGESKMDASDRLMWLMSLPYNMIFKLSIPNCNNTGWEEWYLISFVMSIVWISVFCAMMAEFATVSCCIFEFSSVVMGMLVLAIGTSVPDAMGSIIVARQGEADMAIANAIGSNIFDVLLGLGLPWFFRNLFYPGKVTIQNDNLIRPLMILLGTVVLFVVILRSNKWIMTRKMGMSLLILYIAYVVYTLGTELLRKSRESV